MILKNFVSHQHHAKNVNKFILIIYNKYNEYESKMFLSQFFHRKLELLYYNLIKKRPYTQKVQMFKGAALPQTKKGKKCAQSFEESPI